MIIVDTREPLALREAFAHGLHMQMPVGDIGFTCNANTPPAVIFERKTHADLVASLNDRRWAEQRSRLQSTGARIIYIIEGYNAQTAGPQEKGALQNLALVHDIGTMFTHNIRDTLDQVLHMHTKWQAPPRASTTVLAPPKRGGATTFEGVLVSIREVSAGSARAILERYPRASSVVAAGADALASVPYRGRRIGPVLAKRVLDVLA